MIKQFKQIKDIGVFNDYSIRNAGLNTEFGKLNLIYGLNTYGKSTLAAILKDIADDSNDRIKSKITVPGGVSPKVILNMSEGGIIKYENGKWCNNTLRNKIMVFDSDFVYQNVFDGSELIEGRQAKENFTEFILGDTGVSIATQLEELKKTQKGQKAVQKQIEPNSQRDKSEAKIKKYCETKSNQPREVLIEKNENLAELLSQLKLQQKNEKEITRFQIIKSSDNSKIERFISNIKKAKEILSKSFSLDAELISLIDSHIDNNFKNKSDVISWIEKGVSVLGDGNTCPFCGQSVESVSLVKAWKEYFDDKYQKYLENIHNELDDLDIEWDVFDLSQQLAEVQHYLNNAVLLFGNKFISEQDSLSIISNTIKEIDAEFKPKTNEYRQLVEKAIFNKRYAGYISIDLDMTVVSSYKEKYDYVRTLISTTRNNINKIIEEVQKEFFEGKYSKKIEDIENEMSEIQIMLQRIDEDECCASWMKMNEEIHSRDRKIKELSEKLELDQEEYLNKYFEKIDSLFKSFGGRKFTIEKGNVSNKGIKKIFGIKVSFNGIELDAGKSAGAFFSESDKRALALAIFISKIQNMSEEEKRKQIIVFDDPVTSFDDNRIKNVVKSVTELPNQVEQVIVFTHHMAFAEKISLSNKEIIECFKINRISANGNGIIEMNAEEEFATGFSKAFLKIQKFNESQTDELSENELRVFLEEYLKIVFAKQLSTSEAKNMKFGERIDYLIRESYISDSVGRTLHSYRAELNSGSHTFQGATIEDDRNFSIDMIEYVFKRVKMQ